MSVLTLLIDTWIEAQPEPKPSRTDALREVLRSDSVRRSMLQVYDEFDPRD